MDKVVHFEIPADDTSRAQQFYKEVFGWNILPMPMGEGEDNMYYVTHTGPTDDKGMVQENAFINGGLYKRNKDEGPQIVLNVKSIQEKIEQVVANGGSKLMDPVTVGEMGKHARVKDSEGNIIGLWEDIKK